MDVGLSSAADRQKQKRPMGRMADFREMVADLKALGFSWRDISDMVNVPKWTVRQWAEGSEPGFSAGRAFEMVYRREIERFGKHELYQVRVRQSLPFTFG